MNTFQKNLKFVFIRAAVIFNIVLLGAAAAQFSGCIDKKETAVAVAVAETHNTATSATSATPRTPCVPNCAGLNLVATSTIIHSQRQNVLNFSNVGSTYDVVATDSLTGTVLYSAMNTTLRTHGFSQALNYRTVKWTVTVYTIGCDSPWSCVVYNRLTGGGVAIVICDRTTKNGTELCVETYFPTLRQFKVGYSADPLNYSLPIKFFSNYGSTSLSEADFISRITSVYPSATNPDVRVQIWRPSASIRDENVCSTTAATGDFDMVGTILVSQSNNSITKARLHAAINSLLSAPTTPGNFGYYGYGTDYSNSALLSSKYTIFFAHI